MGGGRWLVGAGGVFGGVGGRVVPVALALVVVVVVCKAFVAVGVW